MTDQTHNRTDGTEPQLTDAMRMTDDDEQHDDNADGSSQQPSETVGLAGSDHSSPEHTPVEGDGESMSVSIPAALGERIATRIEGTEFESVDEYVGTVLDHLVGMVERYESVTVEQSNGGDETDRPPGDQTRKHADDDSELASEDSIEDRLESLGYL